MLKLDPEAFSAESALPLFWEEHHAYREAARDFVTAEITANVEDWEANRDYPRELFGTVAKAGHFGAHFDPRWGGAGPDVVAAAVFVEELARCGSAGVTADLLAHAGIACRYLDRYGTDEQKQRYLAPSIVGDLLGGAAVVPVEADGVGSLGIRAVRDGDDWVLDGAGTLALNGSWADYLVVPAESGSADHPEITVFILDTTAAGVDTRRHLRGGWRTSHTAELSCSGVRVPDGNRLGRPGGGTTAVTQHLEWERVMRALAAVVTAEVSLEQAVSYGRERQGFGRPIASFQVWQHRFADLGTGIELARSLTYHALRLYVAAERGDDVAPSELSRATAMAKLYTDRMVQHTTDECVQVHGGAGYLTEYPAQRYWRDTRLGVPGGGTVDTAREIVASSYGL